MFLKESKLAIILGIIGALSNIFDIFLQLITNLENYLIIKFNFLNQIYVSKKFIFYFLISALISASLYYLSNKNIVKAKCLIERFVREEITDLTLNIRWEYYLQMSQGDISKSILSEAKYIGRLYVLSLSHNILFYSFYLFRCMLNISS